MDDQELEQILNEFAPKKQEDAAGQPLETPAQPEKPEEKPVEKSAEAPPAKSPETPVETPAKKSPEKPSAKAKPPVDNVIDFPQPDTSLTGRIGKLFEKADEYAEQMFPADDVPDDPERERREELLPGVDQ